MSQTVQVAGHYATGVGTSDAASQGVVLGERISDLPLLRPGEVLETVPGMVVTQHSGDGKANQYFLRGYNLDHGTDFATWVEGVPVNMPTNAHGQGYTDLNFLIPELIDRIEYRKGPYFAEDGDFASAGSARIKYVDRMAAPRVDFSVGQDGFRRLLLAGSPAILGANQSPVSDVESDSPRLLTALELQRDDGPWISPERARKINGVMRLSGGTHENGWSASALGYDARWNSTDQVPLALIESGAISRYGAVDPTDGGDSQRAIVSGEHHAHDMDGYSKFSAYAEHYDLRLWSNFTYDELRPQTGDQFEQRESRNFFGGQAVRGWQHELLGRESTTEVGAQLRHDHVDVGLYNSEARVPFQTVSNDHIDETTLGLYAQNSTNWSDKLRTLVGARVDGVDMHVHALQWLDNTGSAAKALVSPKLSIILGPWARTEFFLNVGHGFHSNDARGVVDKIDSTTGDSASRVPALVASRGSEIGFRTEIVPGLQTSAALWRLDSNSELVYAADSAIGSTEANGASKRYGLELNSHAVLSRWLLLDADWAWTHARYAQSGANDEEGDRIPNAVGSIGSLALTMHELGPWSAGLIARYVGSQPLNQSGSLIQPSSFVTNLQGKYRVFSNCTLAVDVLNLFNRKFYDIAYAQDYRLTPTAPVVPEGVTVHPGEPREFRLTVSVNL